VSIEIGSSKKENSEQPITSPLVAKTLLQPSRGEAKGGCRQQWMCLKTAQRNERKEEGGGKKAREWRQDIKATIGNSSVCATYYY